MGCWGIKLQCLQVLFLFFLCKEMPLSRCQTKISVASDVAVRGQLGSKESHTKAPLNPIASGRAFLASKFWLFLPCVWERTKNKSLWAEGRNLPFPHPSSLPPKLWTQLSCASFEKTLCLSPLALEGERRGDGRNLTLLPWLPVGWWRRFLWYSNANHFIRFSFLKQNHGHTVVYNWLGHVHITDSLGICPLNWRSMNACLSKRTVDNHSAGSLVPNELEYFVCVRNSEFCAK